MVCETADTFGSGVSQAQRQFGVLWQDVCHQVASEGFANHADSSITMPCDGAGIRGGISEGAGLFVGF
jgi:hypothetical protein